jgi:3-oxoacyl-[acyl-carrier-protein] synthase II
MSEGASRLIARSSLTPYPRSLKDAGSPEVDKERLGVVVASGIGGVTTLLEQYDILNSKGSRLVSPHTVPMLMPTGPAANIGLELQAQAGVHTPVSACASGAEAIGYAFDTILQ